MQNILIVVDMQNGFARYDQTKNVGKKIIDLLEMNIFDYVIATKFVNKKNGPYKDILNWQKLTESPEIDIIKGIKYDIALEKYVYTPVNSEFIRILKKANDGKKPRHIFIVGVDTDCCVMKTAVDLFEKNIRPIVLLEYCDSNGGKIANDAGIKVMERLIGKQQLIRKKISSRDDIKNIIQQL